MRILHLASFIGNLGDIFSHNGLYQYVTLQASKISPLKIDRIEIRRLYQNYVGDDKLDFNALIDLANKDYEVFIVGGGGFLDYWLPHTNTGTTFEIDYDKLNNSNIPLIFSSIGSYPHQAIPEHNYKKMAGFLSNTSNMDNVKIMLRNDGSYNHLSKVFGETLTQHVQECGDHSYMYLADISQIYKLSRSYICLNIAPDQLVMLSTRRSKNIDIRKFFKSIVKSILYTSKTFDVDVVLVPHMSHDFKAINELIGLLPDLFVRERIKVAPYDGLGKSLNAIYSLYSNSKFNICMRLHSNIMSILAGSKTYSLGVLDRVVAISNQHVNSTLIDDLEVPFGSIIENDHSIISEDLHINHIRNKIKLFLEKELFVNSGSD